MKNSIIACLIGLMLIVSTAEMVKLRQATTPGVQVILTQEPRYGSL